MATMSVRKPHHLDYRTSEPGNPPPSQAAKWTLIVLGLVILAVVFFCANLAWFIRSIGGLGDH